MESCSSKAIQHGSESTKMIAPLLCLLIKRMSQPVLEKLNSNKKCHRARTAKGDSLHQKEQIGHTSGNAYQQTSRVSINTATLSRYHWHRIQWMVCSGHRIHQGSPTQLSHGVIWVPICLLPFWKGAEGRLGNQKVWEFTWKIKTQLKEALLPAEVWVLEVIWYVGTYRK